METRRRRDPDVWSQVPDLLSDEREKNCWAKKAERYFEVVPWKTI